MKTLAVVLASLLVLPVASAQSREEAAHWAKQVSESAGKLKNVPFVTPLDLPASVLFEQDGSGALVMPAKGLDRERIRQAGRKPVPVGALWFLGVKPATSKHAAFASKRLHVATVHSNERHTLYGVLLAVRQNADHKELLVYGRGQQPLLKIPMTEMPLHQRRHIDLLVAGEEDRGYLVLHLYGGYLVRIPVVTGRR